MICIFFFYFNIFLLNVLRVYCDWVSSLLTTINHTTVNVRTILSEIDMNNMPDSSVVSHQISFQNVCFTERINFIATLSKHLYFILKFKIIKNKILYFTFSLLCKNPFEGKCQLFSMSHLLKLFIDQRRFLFTTC